MKISQSTDVGKLGDYLFPIGDEVEVAQGKWRYGRDTMSTSSVASCIAIAAHNEISKVGLIGHFSSISHTAQLSTQLLREQFDTAAFNEAVDFLPELGPVSATCIWLGGAAIHAEASPEIQNGTLADRHYVEARITEMAAQYNFVKELITLDWNTTEYDLYVRLDCESGSLLIQPIIE